MLLEAITANQWLAHIMSGSQRNYLPLAYYGIDIWPETT